MRTDRRHWLSCIACLLSALGCGAAQHGSAGAARDPLAPLSLYPLVTGAIWSYDVDTGEGPPTLAVTRVEARTPDRAEVRSGDTMIVYEIRPEGIYKPTSGGWLLRAPIAVGSTWESARGRHALVRSITEAMETPEGRRAGCVRVEESDDGSGRRISTVYCPGIGPVLVESSLDLPTTGRSAAVRARLRGANVPPASPSVPRR